MGEKRMKKIVIALLFCMVMLTGCKKTVDLNKTSKNLNSYTMQLELDTQTHTLIGSQVVKYRNNTGTILDALCFHLYPRAFSENAVNRPVTKLNEANAYPNGASYGDIIIDSVSVNGVEVEETYEGTDKDILKLSLDTFKPEEWVEVSMTYHVLLPNINHRFGYGNNTINLANFYPIACVYEDGEFVTDPYDPNGDPFYSDMANYEVTITYPETYILAHTGNVLNSTTQEGKKIDTLKAIVVRDFAMVLSDKFEVISDKINDVTVKYYYFDKENPQVYLKTAMDAIATFSDLFGKYPYEEFSVVHADFVHGGMEYPMLVYISDDVTDSKDYKNVIIHETAHQWWYGMVGNSAYRHAWMDEGLTEYSTLLFYEKNEDYGVNIEEAILNSSKSYASFVSLCEEVLGNCDTSMNRMVNQYDTEPEYVYMTYVKGMLLFDSLRDTIGDKKFFKGLKDYFATYQFSNVRPEQMIASFEKACGTKLTGFFDSWLNGKVVIK